MPTSASALEVVRGAYPERAEERLSKLDETFERLSGGWLPRRARRQPWQRTAELAASSARELEALSDAKLREVADALRPQLRRYGFTEALVGRSFALVREAAVRSIGQRHRDVQLAGGSVLLHGRVAEMETGEGKTLTATLPACTAALAGIPVHVITVNDYLAARDAEWMGPIYRALGITVGLSLSGTEPSGRRTAYACEVAYCTNKQVVFDYLFDRLALEGCASQLRLRIERLAGGHRVERLLHRGLHFAIVDEADSVLVDEARTPLIISGRASDPAEQAMYRASVELARALEPADFAVDARQHRVELRDAGRERLAALAEPLGGIWKGQVRREEFVCQALTALHCFQRDQHYLVQAGKVQIIDEYTGRLMPDRSWEFGLHQMIEAKEGVPLTGRQEPRARISYQRFFRRYLRLAGMTGTAREVARELWSVYRLPVVRLATHRPLRRVDQGIQVHATADEKWRAIVRRIAALHEAGRPVLVGTRSVGASEHLAALLSEAGLPHRVLNARQDREEAETIARAGDSSRITVATNMAGRGTDIRLSPEATAAGGLHVIATELHEARRIDRQLFGRCGRQGDPGSHEAIVSLEDELFAKHADALGKRIAGLARPGGDPRPRLLALRRAQRAAERLHSRSRRALLRQDQQLDALLAFAGRRE